MYYYGQLIFLSFLGGCLPVLEPPPIRFVVGDPWPPCVAVRRSDPHHAPSVMFRRQDGRHRVEIRRQA